MEIAWIPQATRAVGRYEQGVTYSSGDELFDGSSLSQAKVGGVTSYPFVAPTGSPFFVFQGVMIDQAQLAKQIIFGNRYQSTEGYYITGYRIETVVGNEYSVYVINDPTGPAPIGELIQTFTALGAGWQTFNLEARAVTPGSFFDIITIVNEPDPTPIEVIASYNYLTPQNITDPLSGQITQSRGQPDLMQVSYTDNNATDRTALIQGLTPGDQIIINLLSYAIQSNSVGVGFANIVVAPAVTTIAGIQDITFETVVATPISVAEDLNYWPTSNFPLVQGLKGVDIPYADIVPNDNAYGTDIIVQQAYIPDPAEWWLKIVAGSGDEVSAADVRTAIPGYSNIANVAEFLLALAVLSGQVSVVFGRNNITPPGQLLDFGSVQGASWIAPGDTLIASIGISRGDTDLTSLEILVNGVVEAAVPSSSLKSFQLLSIPLSQLDAVQVRNVAGGGVVTDVAVSLIIKSTL
jgi:hypothetical protein